jgi:peptidyl-tRNA hydrolase
MTDHNSPEAIEARKNQIDPLAMYLVVRESLGMGAGKIPAQIGHAVGMLYEKKDDLSLQLLCGKGWHTDQDSIDYDTWVAWKNTSYRKIVLKADDKEWEKLRAWATESGKKFVLVVDAGLTEIAPNSETVFGFFPMYKSMAPKEISKLQALK